MSIYNIQITEPAEKDLYEIGVYISKELLEPEVAKSKLAPFVPSQRPPGEVNKV